MVQHVRYLLSKQNAAHLFDTTGVFPSAGGTWSVASARTTGPPESRRCAITAVELAPGTWVNRSRRRVARP